MYSKSPLQDMGGWKSKVREDIVTMLDKVKVDKDAHLVKLVTPFDELLLHGQLACSNDLTDKAIRSFNECIRILPDSFLALTALGRIRMTQGMFVKAEKYMRKAAEQQPDDLKTSLALLYIINRSGKDRAKAQQLKHFIYGQVEMFIRRLGAGDIFDTEQLQLDKPENIWGKAYSKTAVEKFLNNRYTVLHNVLPDGYPELLLRQQHAFIQNGHMVPEPGLKRLCFTDMPLAIIANYQLVSLLSRITGRTILPAYAFSIHYLPGGFIEPHKDRPQNELSMSLSLATSSRESVLYAGDGEDRFDVDLDVNSALLYRGAEVTHGRTPVPEGHSVDQTIFGFRTIHPKHCYCT